MARTPTRVLRSSSRNPHQGRTDPVPDVGRERARFPGPARHLHGHGPAAEPLLHQLVPQHVPVRAAVRWQEFRRDVPPDAAGRLPVRRAGLLGREGRGRGTDHHARHGHVYGYSV